MLRLFLLVWVTGSLLGAVATARAQPADAGPVYTPAEVRRDADGDGTPDLAGQRVVVGGRASVPVQPGDPRFNAAIQSGGAGLSLAGERLGAPFAPGDSVVATGSLMFRYGQLHLRTDTYRVVPGPARVPVPRRLSVQAPLEPFEGMLVSFEATAVGTRRVPVGTILMLAAGDSLLYALAFGDSGEAFFGRVQAGGRVRVTGVLGQHDVMAPYREGYQLYPDTPEDVRMIGRGTAFYRLVALIAALLLVAALGGIAFLLGRSRRRLRRQLQSEYRYRLLFEHTDDAVFVHELTGPTLSDMQLVSLNPAAERLFGAPLETLLKHERMTLVADPDEAEAGFQRLLKERRSARTIDVRQADGTPIRVEIDSFLVDEGPHRLVLTLMTDVTQRHAHEQGLVDARERAEAYARLQQSFVANMSHEIRTPLTGIIGFADVLREELTGEHQQFAELIEAGGRRLLDTLDAILEMARLEAQGETLPLLPTDLARALRDATDTLTALARRRDVRLSVEAPEALVTLGSASAFERIVSNLVGNALKFTPAGGSVAVTLRAAPLEGQQTAVLTVRDTGIGISEGFQQQLFEPFSQEGVHGEGAPGGTGLGLSITRRLAGMLGGTISVESRQGEGATFTVHLPLRVTRTPVEADAVTAA